MLVEVHGGEHSPLPTAFVAAAALRRLRGSKLIPSPLASFLSEQGGEGEKQEFEGMPPSPQPKCHSSSQPFPYRPSASEVIISFYEFFCRLGEKGNKGLALVWGREGEGIESGEKRKYAKR